MNPCRVALVRFGIERRRMRPMPFPSSWAATIIIALISVRLANCASLLPTPVSLVYLDDAIQPLPTRSNHGPAQFMQHRPSGLIAAQPENTLQAQSTDAILLAGDLPHGAEPDRQGQVTVLKNGSRGSVRRGISTSSTRADRALPDSDGSAGWFLTRGNIRQHLWSM